MAKKDNANIEADIAAIRATAGGWDPRYFEPDGRLKRRRA